MEPSACIGWDEGRGGGPTAKPLPCEAEPILLCPAEDSFGGGGEAGPLSIDLDIWGLDPKLAVSVSFQRPPSANRTRDLPRGNVTATITAHALNRLVGGIEVGAPIDVAALFANAGVIDAAENDGCELVTSAEGVRLTLAISRSAETTVDLVAVVQAKTVVPLTCPALAQALRAQLRVSLPAPVIFPHWAGP
jgi:hypothetical protein